MCRQLESVIIKPIKDKRSGLPEEIRQPGRKRIPLLDDYKELNEILVRLFRSIMDEFDDDEKKILIRGLTKLDNWFKDKEEENKKNRE